MNRLTMVLAIGILICTGSDGVCRSGGDAGPLPAEKAKETGVGMAVKAAAGRVAEAIAKGAGGPVKSAISIGTADHIGCPKGSTYTERGIVEKATSSGRCLDNRTGAQR